jgi:hypothetical protein
VGTALAAGAALLGTKRLAGVHVGVIGLAVNAAVAVVGSALAARQSALPSSNTEAP